MTGRNPCGSLGDPRLSWVLIETLPIRHHKAYEAARARPMQPKELKSRIRDLRGDPRRACVDGWLDERD